jgi:GNAT superfamily N-acetyltransferase
MYAIREFRQTDVDACAVCLYEGFFSCAIDDKDFEFLCDYAQVLIEKCHFTLVAECDGMVVGFLCGLYQKGFNAAVVKQASCRPHYHVWVKMFLKYYLKLYALSSAFKNEFGLFFKKAQERPRKGLGGDLSCELVALTSRRDYRKGVGAALVNTMAEVCKSNKAQAIRVFTNTAASYTFYDKYGFKKIYEKDYEFGALKGKSFIYEFGLQ